MNTSFQRTTASDEWYTPKEIIDALGPFELDPCAAMNPLWPTADIMWNKEDDGLSRDWGGKRVWLNPPYSQPLLTQFCKKMVENHNGILLLFARTDNKLFQEILFPHCNAIFFMRHRVRFYSPDGKQGGSPGCGSVLLAFGDENVTRLLGCGMDGFFMSEEYGWSGMCDIF